MGLLNTDEAPGPLILPEDPEDLLDLDPVEHLERLLDAGVPLDDIDRHMDSFFGRASASIAPSKPRTLTPKARNNPPTNLTPRSEVPSLDEFLTVAGPQNPHKSTGELTQHWNEHYGHVDPKTLPSLETFLPAAKQDNPDQSEQALTAYWRDRYGALGASEKNSIAPSPAPSPGLLGTAKNLGLKTAAGVVDIAKEVGRKVTSRQQNPPIRQNSPTPTRPPSVMEFVKLNQPLNPHMTVPELAQVWNKDWGHVDPKTLPSLETFMEKNKPLNPDVPEDALAQHWRDYHGALGAPEKNPPVTALPKMTGQATAAQTRR